MTLKMSDLVSTAWDGKRMSQHFLRIDTCWTRKHRYGSERTSRHLISQRLEQNSQLWAQEMLNTKWKPTGATLTSHFWTFSCSTWNQTYWTQTHHENFRVEELKNYVSFWDIFQSTKITCTFLSIVLAHNVPVCDRWMGIPACLLHSNLTHVSKKTWGTQMEGRAGRKATPS